MVCSLASGFYEECKDVDADLADDLASSSLLSNLHRCSRTKHENKARAEFTKQGLSCPIGTTMIDIGEDVNHPILSITEFLKVLALHDKLPLLWGGRGKASEILPRFWRHYRQHEGSHCVFNDHKHRLDKVLPLLLHADEGQTLKKTGIMVVSWHSPMGAGTSKYTDPNGLNLNFLGNSYATRFLATVCLKKVYQKHPEKLDNIISAIAEELRDLYHAGIEVVIGDRREQFFVATIGFKGDWPIHARVGRLQRHFCRRGVFKVSDKSGICHLCRAGEIGFPPHDFGPGAAWRSTVLTKTPWTTPGPLCVIPQSPHQELMHKFDAFHTLHKGCFAELAGSGLVVILDYDLVGPDGKVEVKLERLYGVMSSFCKANGIPLHMDALTKNSLTFPRDSCYPVGSWFKGADTTAVLYFLEDFWGKHKAGLSQPDDYVDSIYDCCKSANTFLSLLYGSGLFLELSVTRQAAQAGLDFLRSYTECAQLAYDRKR
ncbi:unnamed protein product, partial [Symbiodinium necroappetens]